MTPGPMALNFSETNSHDMFAQRLPPSKEHSLPQVLAAAVTHLHALIRELRPTRADWRKVIEFLTDVGHASDERRQEWVLLSDLLGASALVEEINSRRRRRPPPTPCADLSSALTFRNCRSAAIFPSMESARHWRFPAACRISMAILSQMPKS